MAKSYVSSVIDAPMEEVWRALRPFDGIQNYYAAVSSAAIADGKAGDQIGAVRTAQIVTGGVINERLLALSDFNHSLSYQLIDDADLPLCNYIAHVRLFPITDGNKTFIEWHSEYDITGDPAEVHNFIENDVYLACMRGLQKLLEDPA